MARKLRKTQISVLEALNYHGYWCNHSHGWVWGTSLGTAKILDSLVKYGLVEKTSTFINKRQTERNDYKISESGKEYLNWRKKYD